MLHVRARDRDAGHGRAAQREELLQLLFRQVVDGKQRALFLHRILRRKLDNVRCFCYTIPRRNIRAVHLRHFSPLRKKLLDVFSISSVQYISTTKQISNVGIIISIENAIDVVVYADIAGYINSYRNNDRSSCFRFPVRPYNNAVVVHLLMIRGIPRNRHRVGKLYRQLLNDSPAQRMFTVCAFTFRKGSFFYDLLRDSYRIRGVHIFREHLGRLADKHQLTGRHTSVESRVHFLEIACKVSLVQKIEL